MSALEGIADELAEAEHVGEVPPAEVGALDAPRNRARFAIISLS